ncbi:AAA family ATPase [Streptomyces sp. NPDC005791]|uniref:AAA family ATPase n=1 Tax=Streptomyces sp. NPDC005791 TaxID=3364732 RepID=UPI0036C334AF
MPRHFADLTGAATLPTGTFQLAHRVVDDLVKNNATGVIHGPAGTGKTYAVESALEDQATCGGPAVCALSFTARPTMRLVADQLLAALTGIAAPKSRNRFHITNRLLDLLSHPKRLVVVDEAQRLNSDCIELLRHLHDDPKTKFALLYVGGDGCWEVLSREPMLRSRVFRRLPFRPPPRKRAAESLRRQDEGPDGAAPALRMSLMDSVGDACARYGRTCSDAEKKAYEDKLKKDGDWDTCVAQWAVGTAITGAFAGAFAGGVGALPGGLIGWAGGATPRMVVCSF